jgi:phosphate:Na+ symporter
MIHDEAVHLFHQNIAFHELALDIHDHAEPEGLLNNMKSFLRRSGQTQAMYEKLKASEGQLLEAGLQWKNSPTSKDEEELVDRSIEALRQTIHAAKSIKDIHHNMDELRESANDVLHEYFHQFGTNWKGFKRDLLLVERSSDLEILREQALHHSDLVMEQIHADIRLDRIKEIEASSLLNVNREMLSSKKAILKAWGFLQVKQ